MGIEYHIAFWPIKDERLYAANTLIPKFDKVLNKKNFISPQPFKIPFAVLLIPFNVYPNETVLKYSIPVAITRKFAEESTNISIKFFP